MADAATLSSSVPLKTESYSGMEGPDDDELPCGDDVLSCVFSKIDFSNTGLPASVDSAKEAAPLRGAPVSAAVSSGTHGACLGGGLFRSQFFIEDGSFGSTLSLERA